MKKIHWRLTARAGNSRKSKKKKGTNVEKIIGLKIKNKKREKKERKENHRTAKAQCRGRGLQQQ